MPKPSGYIPGFGNHFATEAVAGALPHGRNAPQRPTRLALDHAQGDYDAAWDGFPKASLPQEAIR